MTRGKSGGGDGSGNGKAEAANKLQKESNGVLILLA